MKAIFDEYKGCFLLMLVAGALAIWDGGLQGLIAVAILMVLEVSLSFDNAIVNAKSLGSLTDKQRDWFLLWGFLIAVLGMRLLFPILIVSATAGMAPISLGHDNVAYMAINNPDQYAALLTSSHDLVAGFGGAFLMMVGLAFFFDAEKDTHWVKYVEAFLGKFGNLNFFELVPFANIVVTVVFSTIISYQIDDGKAFLISALIGTLAYLIVAGIKHVLENADGEETTASTTVGVVAKGGIGTLVFMEVRDASFSFDGVIGAFAITENILLIMLGLAVGAYFVRKMTLHLVKAGVMSEYVYLEHGALWAILALAVIMQVGTIVHVPEVVAGSIGFLFIAAAFWSSLIAKRNEAAGVAA